MDVVVVVATERELELESNVERVVAAMWKSILPAELRVSTGSEVGAVDVVAEAAAAAVGGDVVDTCLKLRPAPLSFGSEYVLPAHYDKPLRRLHSHPLDADLVFFERPHVYTFRGVPTTTSVTALAHAFEKPFVPSEAIESMKRGRVQVWPRLEYVHGASRLSCAPPPSPAPELTTTTEVATWTPSLGALMVDGGKTVAVVHPHSMAEGSDTRAVLHMLRASTIKGSTADPFDAYAGTDSDAEVFVFERELSAREIEDAWKHKGMVASHRGTEAHFQAELFFNGLPFRSWEPEMTILLDFVGRYLVPAGLVAHCTEKEIVCVDADVAGSIDLIVYDAASDTYHIIDHKRSDKLKRDLRGYSKMKAPFAHLDDCKGTAYALQTSIYQYILEREYGMRIGERVLLSLHPDQPFVTAVPYLKAETEFIMSSRFELVRARNEVKAMGFECALTGAPLVDAVRLADDGRKVMEKAAVVRELRYTSDAPTRAQFERLVAERTRAVPFSGGVAWRRLMPEGGLVPSFGKK